MALQRLKIAPTGMRLHEWIAQPLIHGAGTPGRGPLGKSAAPSPEGEGERLPALEVEPDDQRNRYQAASLAGDTATCWW